MTDYDYTSLGPINYDQSKVPPEIKEHADYVRTKAYGIDVREAQARADEITGIIANEAKGVANSANLLSIETQNRFNSQIAGNTDISEIIDARGSHQILGERLEQYDNFSSSAINKTKEKLWNKQPVVISAFGDSVTWGYISSTEQSTTNYPKVLQDKLRYIYGYNEIYVINRGYSGEQSRDAVVRYDEVITDSPDLVLIMFGLNDRGQRIYMDEYVDNIRKVVTQFKDDGVEVILMSNTPSIMGNGVDGQSENYRKALKTLATEQAVEYIDVYGESMKLWDSGYLTSADYVPTIHLYDYTFIADIVLKERLADLITIEASEGKSVPMFSPHVNRGLLDYGDQPNSKYQSYVHTSSSTPSDLRFGVYATKPFYLNFEGVIAPSAGSNILRDFGTEITTIDLYSTASNTTYKVPSIYIAEPGYHFFEFKGGEATATFRLNGFDISYSKKMQGTWTPVIKGTSGTFENTYSVANGQYSIIGNLAFVSFDVKLTSLDSGMAGSTLISGLPFTSPVGTVANSMALARYSNVTTSSALGYQINPNSSNIYITEINNSESSLTATSKLTANTRLSASFVMLV